MPYFSVFFCTNLCCFLIFSFSSFFSYFFSLLFLLFFRIVVVLFLLSSFTFYMLSRWCFVYFALFFFILSYLRLYAFSSDISTFCSSILIGDFPFLVSSSLPLLSSFQSSFLSCSLFLFSLLYFPCLTVLLCAFLIFLCSRPLYFANFSVSALPLSCRSLVLLVPIGSSLFLIAFLSIHPIAVYLILDFFFI